MMMNRDRLGFWVKFVAIALAAIFVLSSLLFGIGSNLNYNPLDLFRAQDQQQGGATVSPQDRIDEAKKKVEKNPKDPQAIQDLAILYFTGNRPDEAVNVLKEGQKKLPNNADIPLVLGQVYAQQAQAAAGKDQKDLYGKAGDAFAAAAENKTKDKESYLLAGQSYEQADQPAQAIKYYNGYLDLAPKGKQADEVKTRISTLLKGGSTTGTGG